MLTIGSTSAISANQQLAARSETVDHRFGCGQNQSRVLVSYGHFDTGALRELVSPEAGIIVPYGADPWRLDVPDLDSLEQAAIKLLKNRQEYSKGARKIAEDRFGLDKMVDQAHNFLQLFYNFFTSI